MYNIIIYIYLLGVAIYSRFNEKVRKMWRGERDAFRVLREQVEPGAHYVWFHAASLGEFEQGRPLMEQLRRDHPELKILLTFFSPSGYEVRKDYKGATSSATCHSTPSATPAASCASSGPRWLSSSSTNFGITICTSSSTGACRYSA